MLKKLIISALLFRWSTAAGSLPAPGNFTNFTVAVNFTEDGNITAHDNFTFAVTPSPTDMSEPSSPLTGSEGSVTYAVDKDLKKSVPHTLDMISLNVQIYDANNKAGDEITAATTGNKWKVVKSLQDKYLHGKIWLAEMSSDSMVCAMVVRGTNDKSSYIRDDADWRSKKLSVPGTKTSYKVMSGFQKHVTRIFKNDNNLEKINEWLLSCKNRGYQKIFSGHSLGGAVATWLSIYFESNPNASFHPDYVVTFGSPRLVETFGTDKCPKSLQTRNKAVRIVTHDLEFVDAATLIPPSFNKRENFCFESLTLDEAGNLLEEDDHFPANEYNFVVDELEGGWNLHNSETRYQAWLLNAKKKIEANKPCAEAGTVCDGTADSVGIGSCNENCCFGGEYIWNKGGFNFGGRYECKPEKKPCKEAGTWCHPAGWKSGDCGDCCSKNYGFVMSKWEFQCK